ncbi:uncharacterized protein LOC106158179 [Lingula anatina]|uniref:Uncharacterized protein LOC106158179 n=1 Tax=Lingula anatina TaxID=7574 RepID=A0A1S3HU29_LINAN|nr:uncharacterized protein LOC106158179 [Lingula anatina]|eukprot:XP_013389528.1 uncharacterized protein LOC106158179 [Lingula anatina]
MNSLNIAVLVAITLLGVGSSYRYPSRYTRNANKFRFRRSQEFRFEDCGRNPNRPIHFLALSVTPFPVKYPGQMLLSFQLNVTETLPTSLSVDTTLERKVQLLFRETTFNIPCISVGNSQFGTCTHKDLCSRMAETYDPCDCPAFFEENDFPCSCPIPDGEYVLKDLPIDIPEISGGLSVFADGDYELMSEFYDGDTGRELGCLRFTMSMEKDKEDEEEDDSWWGKR